MINYNNLQTHTSSPYIFCCNDNNTSEIKCESNLCHPLSLSKSPNDSLSFVPILANRLLDCVSITKNDVSVNQSINFNITTENFNYADNAPVCITSFYLTYDYIGLQNILVNNLETYINGDIVTLTPTNLFNAGSELRPYYLFNSSDNDIFIKPCCCNIDNTSRILVRIVQSGRFFEISNLRLFASGYIGNLPFKAEGIISDSTNQNSNILRLTSLGLISANTFDASLCLELTTSPIRLSEKFDTDLSIDCIRPGTNYIAPSTPGTQGTFIGLVDFSFCVSKNINLSQKRKTSLLCNCNKHKLCKTNSLEECDIDG